MKTLYIHIGMPKTGSDAIRDFCLKNKKMLEQEGCRYLKTPEEVFGDVPNSADFKAGIQMVCNTFQSCSKALLSDNEIWYGDRTAREKLWTSLMHEAGQEGFFVRVIAYFCQRDVFLYFLGKRMNREQEPGGKSFEEYMKIFGMAERLSYYKELDQISDIVGKENVTVLGFEEKNLKNGKIYAGFLEALEISQVEAYELPECVKNSGSYREITEEDNKPNDLIQMRDDVIRFSGAMAMHFYQEQKELEQEMRELRGLRHPFRWLFYRVKKKKKRK